MVLPPLQEATQFRTDLGGVLPAHRLSSNAALFRTTHSRGLSSEALDIVKYLQGAEDQITECLNEECEISSNTGDTEPPEVGENFDLPRGESESTIVGTEEHDFRPSEIGDSDYGQLDDLSEVSRLRPHGDGKHRKVIERIADPHALASAYENLKNNKGMSRIFSSQETVGWNWFEQCADELRAGTYEFRPVRRVNIPVLGQREGMRSIRVIYPKDQIVLEAFRVLLAEIYGASLSSHAFNCKHRAFEFVKYGWKGTSWFMNFDVEKSYNEATQKRLQSIIREKVQDQRFLDTLRKMFNAGIVGMERSNVEEGSLLSSILCDIYFQKLDEEVEAIKQEWNTAAKRTISPAYRRLMFIDKSTMARLGGNSEQLRREKQHRLAMAKKLRISRIDYKDPTYTRVTYVRVGDDFLVGLTGNKSTGLKIMKRLTTFLKSNLHLEVDMEKTRLTHAISDKTLFLGAYMRVLDPKDLPEISSAHTRAMAKKKVQTMRVKQQLEERWMRECRNVVLKCWAIAYEKWRRELGKDGAKRCVVETASQQLLSIPEEKSVQWRHKTQDLLHLFISSALQQGLFPKEEVDVYHQVLSSLEKSLAEAPVREGEEFED